VRTGWASAVALIAATLLAGCGSPSVPVAARVGSAVVTRAELDHELAALAANREFLSRVQSGGAITGGGPDGFSRGFVDSVLTQEIDTAAAQVMLARRHVTPLTTAVAASVTTATFAQTYGGLSLSSFPATYRAELVQRTADDVALEAAIKHVSVTPTALVRYRDLHPQQFETFCVSAVLRPTRRQALASAREVHDGESFAAVARSQSLDSSAPNGGRLGCGTSGMFDAAFTRTLTSVAVGVPSVPVHDPQGWYVLDVTARAMRSLDVAAPDIVNALVPDDEAAGDAIASYLASAPVAVTASLGTFDPKGYPPAVTP
jgi:PPIC-type PPIASE domain